MKINVSKLKRNYILEPLKKIPTNTPTGYKIERPIKEDLHFLYIENNLTLTEVQQFLNISKRVLQTILKEYNIKKSKSKLSQLMKEKLKNKSFKESNAKYKVTCLKKYKVDNYTKTSAYKKKTVKTNKTKYGVPNVKQKNIPAKTLAILKSKDALRNFVRENNILNATDLGQKLGISHATSLRYVKRYRIKYLFNYWVSKPEKELRDFVNQYFPTINNSRKIIPPYELDIFIPSKNIAIEFNGNYWHSTPAVQKKDKLKKEICKERGIKLLVVLESEWNKNKYKVLKRIKKEING